MQAMPSYPVICSWAECETPAQFKIAAAWSDGTTRELKTYSLSCAACLSAQFLAAELKQRSCRLTPGETLEASGIYGLTSGAGDRGLVRRRDLEG